MIIVVLIVLFTLLLMCALYCAFVIAKQSEEQIEIERKLRK